MNALEVAEFLKNSKLVEANLIRDQLIVDLWDKLDRVEANLEKLRTDVHHD